MADVAYPKETSVTGPIRPRRRSTSTALSLRAVFLASIAGIGLAAPVALDAQASRSAATLAPPEYRISPGDELSVTFPFNAELNHDGAVGPDGRFTMPQVGNIVLAQSTVDEAARVIAAALRRSGIVEDARPSLTIRQYGASVFVGGEVRNPGLVRLASGMDPLQAVIAAGGLLDTAKSKRIVIIRRDADGTPMLRYVNLREYVRHGGRDGHRAVDCAGGGLRSQILHRRGECLGRPVYKPPAAVQP